jgi:hypothetical protein
VPVTDTSERGLERLICTALSGAPCDPHLQAELDAAQVYTPEQVDEYVRPYLSGVERGQLAPIQNACVANIGMIWTKRAR